MAWAGFELALAMLLAELLETDSLTGFVTNAALDFRHRRDLISSLSAIKLRGTQSLVRITALLGEAKGMNKERNDAVHAVWASEYETGRPIRLTMRNKGIYEMDYKPASTRHLKTVAKRLLAQVYNRGLCSRSGAAFKPRSLLDISDGLNSSRSRKSAPIREAVRAAALRPKCHAVLPVCFQFSRSCLLSLSKATAQAANCCKIIPLRVRSLVGGDGLEPPTLSV